MSRRAFVVGLVILVAAIAFPLGVQSLTSSSATAASGVDEGPGVANLDPALLDALRRASSAAADDGVALVVQSGWRSPEHQQQLFDEAVAEYGSAEAAARWVASPATSSHVSGHAVDVGPPTAAAWLSARGAAYGLCQIYDNEPWHYELRVDAVARGCPRRYADPTHDPRMQP
jgi:LAS superfamily LD-carboxypeptidase LdcB